MISQLCLALFLSQLPQTNNSTWPAHKLLIGHRGARAQEPENTIRSFRRAIELGADGIEFDVFFSKDKIPVVIHDDTLERTTDGEGLVWEKTVAELQSLNAAKGWLGVDDTTIPTLAEALDSMPDNAVVNIELKGEGNFTKEEFAESIFEVMANQRDRLFIIVSSFDAELLEIMRKADSTLSIGLLLDDKSLSLFGALRRISAVRPNALHISPRLGQPWIIRLAHSKGLRVMIWTVNDQSQADDLLAAGVDGIFSDMPNGFTWSF